MICSELMFWVRHFVLTIIMCVDIARVSYLIPIGLVWMNIPSLAKT